ncbi:hypothetical protein, partial [Rothia nasisuis]|uniref:hypothetical protein n=1 Tax=Rothia nasisuis TaxID=2109647 RepID=UPI001F40DF98
RYTFNSNKFHAQPEDDTALFQDFAVSVTDNDGDTASGTLTVEILDDVPVEDIRSVIFQNSAGFSFVGTAAQMGADQDGAQLNWTQAPTGLFYQGTLLQYEGVGTNTLIAFVGEGDDRVNVFKLTGNPDGSYVYEQFQP